MVGFVGDVPTRASRTFIEFDTHAPGNSNSGHVYGTELSDADRAALLEYLKTFNGTSGDDTPCRSISGCSPSWSGSACSRTGPSAIWAIFLDTASFSTLSGWARCTLDDLGLQLLGPADYPELLLYPGGHDPFRYQANAWLLIVGRLVPASTFFIGVWLGYMPEGFVRLGIGDATFGIIELILLIRLRRDAEAVCPAPSLMKRSPRIRWIAGVLAVVVLLGRRRLVQAAARGAAALPVGRRLLQVRVGGRRSGQRLAVRGVAVLPEVFADLVADPAVCRLRIRAGAGPVPCRSACRCRPSGFLASG